MRQYPKYQTICDYAPTISHDMSVTHDIKRCETPMQKLQEIIAYGISAVRTTLAVCPRISLTENSPKNSLSYIQKLCYGRAFCYCWYSFRRGGFHIRPIVLREHMECSPTLMGGFVCKEPRRSVYF